MRVLAVILAVWEPLSLALFVAPVITTIATRGAATAAFLLARIVVAGIGIAAGISLWRGDPHARRLAAVALILTTGDILAEPAEQASLGALDAFLAERCGPGFERSLISASAPDPAMTRLVRGR